MEAQSSSLFPEATTNQSQVAGLRYLLDRHLEREVLYQNEIAWLTENLLKARRQRFAAMKERWESEEQVILFNEAEVEAGKPDPQGDAESSDSLGGCIYLIMQRKKHGRASRSRSRGFQTQARQEGAPAYGPTA